MTHTKTKKMYLLFFKTVSFFSENGIQEYQLMPQTIYKWNKSLGYFEEKNKNIPFSFFGFSVYINNNDNYGFICHLIDKEVRLRYIYKI